MILEECGDVVLASTDLQVDRLLAAGLMEHLLMYNIKNMKQIKEDVKYFCSLTVVYCSTADENIITI